MQETQTGIETIEELTQRYAQLEKKCQIIDDCEDPGSTFQQLIQNFTQAQKFITDQQMFSENQKLKEIHTQSLKFLTLPYYIGFLYGKISNPRRQAIEQSQNYLQAYLNLIDLFHSEDEELFPSGIKKTWKQIQEKNDYNLSREQVIANHKEKKNIQMRYANSLKIKQQSDQRQTIRDFLMLKIYDAVTQLKNIEEQKKILEYKATLLKDPQEQERHREEMEKPIPKMKVWQIKKTEEIQKDMIPPGITSMQEQRKNMVAQVWQQNANKPTISLEEVGEMEYQNMINRQEREAKQRAQNQVDTDSDKQENDDRMKKEARAWDDWKDAHEKGAGNRGNK